MSAIFDPSASAYLVTANNLAGSPTYPILFGCWIKLTDVTNPYSLCFMTDNAALGSIDFIDLSVRGDVANDPLRVTCAAAGSGNSSFASLDGMTSGAWTFVWGYLSANNNRKCGIGSTEGTAETTARAVSGLTHAAIGTQYYGSAPNGYLDGKMAGFFVSNGFSGNLTEVIRQLKAGVAPIAIYGLADSLSCYQPMLSGLNETGYVGPSWTNNNVTFSSGDHPSTPVTLVLDMPCQDSAMNQTVDDQSVLDADGSTVVDNTLFISYVGSGGSLRNALALGEAEQIVLPHPINLNGPCTIEFLFKLDIEEYSTYDAFSVVYGDNGSAQYIYFDMTSHPVVNIQVNLGTAGCIFNLGVFSVTHWHHYAIVRTGGLNCDLYIDGSYSMSNDIDPFAYCTIDGFGFDNDVKNAFGKISGIKVYNTARTAAQIHSDKIYGMQELLKTTALCLRGCG